MKTLKKYISEGKNDGGDCFPTANRLILDRLPIDGTDEKDYKLVHALVHGQGALQGRRFVHAFILFDNKFVIDKSNGNDIFMRKNIYYAIGGIQEKEKGAYAEYTVDEARKRMLQKGTHGPWDIDLSLSERFDMASKYGVRISAEDRKKLKSAK